MYTQEVQAQLAVWRAKALAGELTLEEMKEAIRVMRGERRASWKSPEEAKKGKAKKEVKNADDLLDELGGM